MDSPSVVKREVRHLRPGDRVDLEGDPYADPANEDDFSAHYRDMLCPVDSVKAETEGCYVVHFDETPSVGFPPDHCLRVVTRQTQEIAIEQHGSTAMEQGKPRWIVTERTAVDASTEEEAIERVTSSGEGDQEVIDVIAIRVAASWCVLDGDGSVLDRYSTREEAQEALPAYPMPARVGWVRDPGVL